MRSEALRSVRTMREVKTSLGASRVRKLRTTNSLSRTQEEKDYLESIKGDLDKVMNKERKRYAAYQASADRLRCKILKARDKLAKTVNRNRALTTLRHELQFGKETAIPPEAFKPKPALKQVTLDY